MNSHFGASAVAPFLIGVFAAVFITAVIDQIRLLKLRLDFQRELKETT